VSQGQKLPHGQSSQGASKHRAGFSYETEISNNPHKAVLGSHAERLDRVADKSAINLRRTQRVIMLPALYTLQPGSSSLSEILLAQSIARHEFLLTLELISARENAVHAIQKSANCWRTLSGAEDAMVVQQ
jgi:hypothetical protein